MNTEQILNQATQIVIEYGPKLIGAIVVWIIGSWVIKMITKGFSKMMDNRGIDPSLKPFLKGIIDMLLESNAGHKRTRYAWHCNDFIYCYFRCRVGLAVGMALSGTLQNFAGGVMILIFKPFKVGDVIDAQGYLGSVSQIQIFNTILKTPDNKTIIIPNGGLSTSSMTNYSTEPQRRVDWTIGIGYGDDVDKAKSVIKNLCDEDSRILKEPELFIAVSELADSSVNFAVRAWVNAENYWPVFFELNEKVYKTFGKEGLNIPFPQMDVHLHKENV